MVRFCLVRHGQAAKGWGDDLDPGLSDQGHHQAENAARHLAGQFAPPVRIISSPMKRCQQTAQKLCDLWQSAPHIAPEVIEIPSPRPPLGRSANLSGRAAWLQKIRDATWSSLLSQPELYDSADLPSWRTRLLAYLLACDEDSIIFTHFVAINTAIGFACNDDRFLSLSPDYCSVWYFETDKKRLHVIARGQEMKTKIL